MSVLWQIGKNDRRKMFEDKQIVEIEGKQNAAPGVQVACCDE